MIRVGVAGMGMMGQFHLRAYQQIRGAAVVALAESDPGRREGAERIAGNLQDKKQDEESALNVDVVKLIDPTVVNVENKDMKPGEKKVLNQGKQGLLVEVYRGPELISTDRYEAENEIVQLGPGSDWTEQDK